MIAPARDVHDVVIMGGGLAGLTLALQLRQRLPGLDVLVLERRTHPVPLACHKVGESTVEIGAHYFAEVLGLQEHLQGAQLRKFGFRFFFSDGRRDIENVTELGASRPLPTPAWQIDRGLFENFLAQEAQRRGVRFEQGALVRDLQWSDGKTPHALTWQRGGEGPRTARAHWLVDACGRAGLVKRRLGLERESPHGAHAVWFRIADRIRIDDWSDDLAWRARCVTPTRWLSTNHLVGPGYWVWLIPLASGAHSVGIVADPRWHPLERMNSFERAMDWLAEHQPRLHEDLDGKRDRLLDFAYLRRFAHDCTQVFSAERWALAGEAGRFLDPFYSPGSDFIAIANTYITELIVRDHAGQPIAAHAQLYEQTFRSMYDSTLALYLDQYGLFGDAQQLPLKVLWDYTYYWGVLAQLACQGRLADLAALSHLRDELALCQRLNLGVQRLLRDASAALADQAGADAAHRRHGAPVLIDQAAMPWFVELNRSLADELDGPAFLARLRANTARLARLAAQIASRCEQGAPGGPATASAVAALRALLPPAALDDAGEDMLFAAPAPHPAAR